MWVEESKNGKFKFCERYEDYMTGKTKRVSITMDKNHNPVKSALMIGLKDGKVDTVETVKPN